MESFVKQYNNDQILLGTEFCIICNNSSISYYKLFRRVSRETTRKSSKKIILKRRENKQKYQQGNKNTMKLKSSGRSTKKFHLFDQVFLNIQNMNRIFEKIHYFECLKNLKKIHK